MPPWNVCVSRASGLGMVWWVSFLSRADGTVSEHLRLCSSALCACLVRVLKVLSLAVCLSAAGALARLWRWVLVFVGVSGFVPLFAWRLFSGERAPLVWRACAQVRVFGSQFCASSSVRMPEWGARRLVPFLCGFESATCSRMIARVRVSGRASPRAWPIGPGVIGPGDRRATALPGAAFLLLD